MRNRITLQIAISDCAEAAIQSPVVESFKGVRKNKRSQRKTRFFCPYWKTSNKLPRNKNKNQKNNIMFKPGSKSKRNSEESCLLCFCCQPWTSHGSVEVSWVKLLKTIKMVLNIICMMPVEFTVCSYHVMRNRFKENPHSIVAWMSRNSFLKTGAKSEAYITAAGLEPTTT